MALDIAGTFGLAVQGTASIDERCKSVVCVLGGRLLRLGTGVLECLSMASPHDLRLEGRACAQDDQLGCSGRFVRHCIRISSWK